MGVFFLASALLAGLALAFLPPLIHLISKRRARRVRFGAIDFVLRSQKRTTRSLRIRQLVLLCLRTLLIVCVVLAIARPVFREKPAEFPELPPLAVVFVLDESASMLTTLDGKSAAEHALSQVKEAVTRLPDDVRVALLGCGEPMRELVPVPTFDREPLLSVLGKWRPGYGRSNLRACVQRAADWLENVAGKGERRVSVFSDLAAHAFTGEENAQAPAGMVVEWVRVLEDEPPPNLGLSAPALERLPRVGNDAVTIEFVVSQFGGVAADQPVDLIVDGRAMARLSVPMSPETRFTRSFTHDFGDAKKNKTQNPEVVLALADDALAVDNQVRIPVELPPPVRVLLVDGEPHAIPFQDEVFYLRSALRQAKKTLSQMRIEVISPGQLNASMVADARVVVLANVSELSDSVASALQQFVRAGGGLLITAGQQLNVDAYNHGLREILPGRLRGAKGQALLDNVEVQVALGLGDFAQEHPIFRGIARVDSQGLPGLRRVQTHSVFLLEPEADAPREVLMRFTNETPAMVERRVDAGRVIFLATSVDREWTDLPIRPGYLPLMQQTVLYLAGSLDAAGPRFLRVGEARELVLPRGAERMEVLAPDGRTHRLQATRTDTDEPIDAQKLQFSETQLPGIYRVRVKYPGGEAREIFAERFSVLIDEAESDLRRADESALRAAVPQGASVRGGRDPNKDAPLWRYFLLAAVLVLCAEAWWLRRA